MTTNELSASGNCPETTDLRRVGLEMYFLCSGLLAVFAYLMNTPVMTVLIVVNIAARFLFIGRRGDWIFLLIGVIAGGGNDLLSMLKGVYYYTPPSMLKQIGAPIPGWMLLFWGHIFVAFRQLFQLPAFQAGPAPAHSPWKIDKRLIADLLVVVAFRIIIYNFVHRQPIPTIGFAAVLALRLIVIPPKKRDWILIAIVMIIGPAFEAGLIAAGLYVYFDPVFLGMPAWLLIYWVFIVPIFMKGIFERVEWGQTNKSLLRN